MTVAERPSDTGLLVGEVRALRRAEKVRLFAWHEVNAGDNDGVPWLPGAIRRLSIEARLLLADDQDRDAAWRERERRRCTASVEYFTEAYGHVGGGGEEDDEGDIDPGPPLPFELWPEQPGVRDKSVGAASQREVLAVFQRDRRIIVLKARQLGLTWLALHFGFHLIALLPAGQNAVVLGLSQDGIYAKRLLERARRINMLLPPWLRLAEDRDTMGSKSEFKLLSRGRFVSLPGTPDAPRSWQADLSIADEGAFMRNGNAAPTIRALLPASRRVIYISSGNGPPEVKGNGQHFARTYVKAEAGQNRWSGIFLPDSTHPDRDEQWREEARTDFDTDEEFLAEHPESSADALIGAGVDRFFPLAHIAAAIKLGAELDRLLGTEDMPPPAGTRDTPDGSIVTGHDWGEHAFALPLWPLEAGGIYVPPGELVGDSDEPAAFTTEWHERLSELQDVDRRTGRVVPPVAEARFDAAGVQSMRTFLATARSRYTHQYAGGEVRSRSVPFGKTGDSGKGYKRETAGYLKRLFRRAGEGRTVQVIAISPANETFIRQLRGLQSDARDVWTKDDDHGPDALVAAAQRIAKFNRAARGDG